MLPRPGRTGNLEKECGALERLGSGSQWGSRELVGKVGEDLASGLSCACL